MGDFIQNINWEFIIALLAIVISIYSIYIQRRHNTLSQTPIPLVVKYNYSNYISVKIWNKGIGPLIIKSVKVGNHDNLIDTLPSHIKKFKFVEYINNFNNRTITPNENLNMIEFKIRIDKQGNTTEGYASTLDEIKQELHNKKIVINYTDIFNNSKVYTSNPLNFKDGKDELAD